MISHSGNSYLDLGRTPFFGIRIFKKPFKYPTNDASVYQPEKLSRSFSAGHAATRSSYRPVSINVESEGRPGDEWPRSRRDDGRVHMMALRIHTAFLL